MLAKAAAHWLVTGLPLVIVAPLFGLMFDMRGEAILSLALDPRCSARRCSACSAASARR